MFPTAEIRRYINLAFTKKLDEIAKGYAQEVPKIREKMSPNSGMYFQTIMDAGIRLQKAKVDAWIEIVREACCEANRPVDTEVRNYIIGEIHNMCEAGKGHVTRSLGNQIRQSGINLPANLLPSLTAQANDRVSAIESEIVREFKIEEFKEGIEQSVVTTNPVETKPPSLEPKPMHDATKENSRLSRGDKIALWIGIPTFVIAVFAVVVALTTPEIRRWLKLDKTPDTTQQTTLGASPAKTPSAPTGITPNPSSSPAPKPASTQINSGQGSSGQRTETGAPDLEEANRWERQGDEAAKTAIVAEMRLSEHDPVWSATESPNTPLVNAVDGWNRARYAWKKALIGTRDPQRIEELKQKIDGSTGLTCSELQTDNVECLPNGGSTDILSSAGIASSAEHIKVNQ